MSPPLKLLLLDQHWAFPPACLAVGFTVRWKGLFIWACVRYLPVCKCGGESYQALTNASFLGPFSFLFILIMIIILTYFSF